MVWVKRMQRALSYVEDHLTADVRAEEVAREINSSAFHFQRMFVMLTGVTFAEYLRRRRLTMAARDLITTSDSIADVAARYRYESQASFTRAFGRMHGFPPGKTGDPGRSISAYPPLRFNLTVKGDSAMNYEVREKPAFRLVGKEWEVSTRDGENFRVIPGYWEQTMKEGSLQKLMALAKPEGLFGSSCLGVAFDIDDANDRLKYMICVESSEGNPPQGWSVQEVPAMTYAIFKDQGTPLPKAIEKTLTRIFQEWFPSTKYEHAGGPEIEVYHDESRYEIWIPVITK